MTLWQSDVLHGPFGHGWTETKEDLHDSVRGRHDQLIPYAAFISWIFEYFLDALRSLLSAGFARRSFMWTTARRFGAITLSLSAPHSASCLFTPNPISLRAKGKIERYYPTGRYERAFYRPRRQRPGGTK